MRTDRPDPLAIALPSSGEGRSIILAESGCQRWRSGRTRFRPTGELFDPKRCGVEVILERDGKPFIERHHYAGRGVPPARLYCGLFERQPFVAPRLLGVAAFTVPMTSAVITTHLNVEAAQGCELGRFVLLDDPAAACNAESWFLSRAMKHMRAQLPGILGVVSYCDPVERRSNAGDLVKPGHHGIVYRATNAGYRGRSKRRTLILAPDGTVVSERAIQKLRNDESGAAYAYRSLLEKGAPTKRLGEAIDAYLQRALSSDGFRRLQHPGNHVFTWKFERAR